MTADTSDSSVPDFLRCPRGFPNLWRVLGRVVDDVTSTVVWRLISLSPARRDPGSFDIFPNVDLSECWVTRKLLPVKVR